ncbi:hypothetical protein Mapa_000181 [Marchantia paleacea]|nr:hypothetical protein Mapa_000181 [Marchantia paleacea]
MDLKLPELYPVVIPPISHPPFDCQGKGLLYKSHSRESVDTLRSWITSKRVRTPLQRPKVWWQAQLLLYGLDPGKSSAKLAEVTQKLKDALTNGLQAPSKEIIDLENELNAKFRHLNADARDTKYQALESDESRVKFDPLRFLQERFPTKGKRKKDDLVVLKIQRYDRYQVHTVAESLGLCTVSADAPGADDARWLIVGCDHDVILERQSQIEAKRSKWMDEKVKAKRQRLEAKARELEAQIGPGKGILRDVVGEWHVESPSISETWPHKGTDFRMSIYFHSLEESDELSDDHGESSDSSSETVDEKHEKSTDSELLWANFHLGVVHGVLQAKAELSASGSLPSGPIPFTWRGRDSEEEQIQLDMSGRTNRGTLTLLSPTKLKGVLKGGVGSFKFEGSKVSRIPAYRHPQVWSDLTQEQWNVECVNRWK